MPRPDFVLANVSVDFEDGIPAGQLEAAIEAMRTAIPTAHPQVERLFVEARDGGAVRTAAGPVA